MEEYVFHVKQDGILLFTLSKDRMDKIVSTPYTKEQFLKMQIQDGPSLDQVLGYHKRKRRVGGVPEPRHQSSTSEQKESPNTQEPWDWSDVILEPYGYTKDDSPS